MKRRSFIKGVASATMAIKMASAVHAGTLGTGGNKERYSLVSGRSNFEREPLRFPFGFKGGFLTELWQSAVALKSQSHGERIGLATQSVLYGDAGLFARYSEAASNAMMFAVTDQAVQLMLDRPFVDPIDLQRQIFAELLSRAKSITQAPDLNANFVYNALVAADHAAWLSYADQQGTTDFVEMLPPAHRQAFAHRNSRLGILFQVSYHLPLDEIVAAVKRGYFIIKIKTGQSGTVQEMVEKDAARILEIHRALKGLGSPYTPSGEIYYTLDFNGRYPDKHTLKSLLRLIDQKTLSNRLLLIEEPFHGANQESVSDIDYRIAADESADNPDSTRQRIAAGYQAIVLKSVAKTLSNTIGIVAEANKRDIPCICSDLTVTPVLLNWHKNVAGRVKPFPGLGMGMLETNGAENYVRWAELRGRQPFPGQGWADATHGMFELDDDFYRCSGGIFEPLPTYTRLFQHT